MRICVLNEFFYPDTTGGTATVVSDLARRLADVHGEEVVAIASRHSYRGGKRFGPKEEWEGLHILRPAAPNLNAKSTPLRTLGNLILVANASLKVLTGKRYDAVLTTTAPPFLPMVASLAKRVRGIPYVYIVYDLEPDRIVGLGLARADSLPARKLRAAQKRWLHGAHKVVAIGRCVAERLEKEYALPAERIAVVATGSDEMPPLPLGQSKFRAQHGLEGFVVMYAGNFGRYHDFDSILDAAKELRDDGVVFALVGEGAQKEKIRRRIADEHIQNARLFDFVPKADYPDMLAAADACLVTMEASLEGTCVPSKFFSTMAAGCPTIAVVGENCEVARIVREVDCGVQVTQGQPIALANAIRQLRDHPEACDAMRANARRALAERYTTSTSAQSIQALLAQASASVSQRKRS